MFGKYKLNNNHCYIIVLVTLDRIFFTFQLDLYKKRGISNLILDDMQV